jgi:hypothetical protein
MYDGLVKILKNNKYIFLRVLLKININLYKCQKKIIIKFSD